MKKEEVKPPKGTEDLGDKNSHQYKCKKCKEIVNFHFIMKCIKDSGFCPRCYDE